MGGGYKGSVCSTNKLQPCLDPLNQNGTMTKAGLIRLENVLGKIQPSERYYEIVFVFRRGARLCA